MTKDEALKLALDYIQSTADYKMGHPAACATAYDLREALAQPEQERPWVGLTPTDMEELSGEWWEPNENQMALISWVEAKLKEKNT